MELKTIIWIFIIIFSLTAIITLLGVTNVLKSIKEKYLDKLFYTLIIEVVIAVVMVFKNADLNQPDISLSNISQRAGVEIEFKDQQQEANYLVEQVQAGLKIEEIKSDLETARSRTIELINQIEELQNDVDSCAEKYSDSQKSFYSKVERLRMLINNYSGSINLWYKPEEKVEVFNLLEDIFEILGTLDSNPANRIKSLQRAYSEFEKRHGINKSTQLMITEYETSILIREYLNNIVLAN